MSTIETNAKLSVSTEDVNNTPASGQANGGLSTPLPQSAIEGFDRWIKDFQKYESVLNEMAKVTADPKFKEELATIEHWFKVLNEPERTAALYTLLQSSTQDQLRFFVAVLQQMIRPEEPKAVPNSRKAPEPAAQVKPKLGKLAFRPPSLNIDDLESPITPTPAHEQTHHSLLAQAALNREAIRQNTPATESWANMVNTPLIPMFQKDVGKEAKPAAGSTNSLPGFSGINPYTLNMLANAGLSAEAQVLAAQLVMSGLVQPTGLAPPSSAKPKKAQGPTNWRTPTSARYPASALRSSGLRPSSGLKSAGLKSSGLGPTPATPLSAVDSPREEEFEPEMLNDIPTWLRSLRLHKYTSAFDGLTWQEMVVLDDATLEAKGVAALGARRRLLRTFEHVRKRMGMDEPTSATPTTSAIPTGAAFAAAPEVDRVPHSALPRSKLSINSPIFTPSWDSSKVPNSATPTVSATEPPATTTESVVVASSSPA
ncbi:Protein VTS1 [Psilocybe cubensis]|uniref:SAM domain-containing protein n=2 Tax=Psilocybe cubensis TaxID=181762 RepID=A0A8H8CN68_PSICU|nr:Protein VTS1 [Psilocybe cubensis]KAH9485206.1 Protein VTS1 [Psilocybe cubensis]